LKSEGWIEERNPKLLPEIAGFAGTTQPENAILSCCLNDREIWFTGED
jgi:hypothetical protein